MPRTMVCHLIMASLMIFIFPGWSIGVEQVKLCDETMIDPGSSRTWTFHIRKDDGSITDEERANALVIPKDGCVVIELWGRLHFDRLAGSTTAMLIRVNGMTMDAEQLINKPICFQTRGGAVLTWYGNGSWRILYSPDFKAAVEETTNPYSVIGVNPYKFVFDITGMVTDGKNSVTIQHTVASIASRLILRDVTLRVEGIEGALRARRISDNTLPIYVPRRPTPFSYSTRWLDGGGIQIKVANESFLVSTDLSTPGGIWHQFSERELPAKCGLRAHIERRTERNLLLRAKCGHYSFERSAECHAEWIDVSDAITNLTNDEVGICVRHIVETDGMPEKFYLNGLNIQLQTFRSRGNGNTTALLVGGMAMVGLLPIDDVFRIHCRSFKEGSRIGICDAELVLPPNGTVVMRWRIHPLVRPQPIDFEPDADYWAFINSVRRGLGVNFTLDGPFAFLSSAMVNWDDEALSRWLYLRSVKYVSSTIGKFKDGRYAHGTAFLMAKEDHEIWRRLFARIRRIRPQIKCLMYFHCFISTEEGAEKKYEDSRLLDATGKQPAYPHSAYLPLFYPTVKNSYGAAVSRYFDVALNEIGADGIYWDEIEYSATLWTYDCWDGYSADIHPTTFAVLRKKAAIPILTQPWRMAQIERLLKAGKVVIGNGMPLTQTMAKLNVHRFRETASLFNLLDSHTYTPIGLGDHLTQRTEQDVVDQIRRNLDFGALYYYYAPGIPQTHTNLTEHMFPFTPIELHHGVLIGRERILTNRSGIFGWGDVASVKVFVYDESGKQTNLEPEIRSEGGATLVKLKLPQRHVAAIVRQ